METISSSVYVFCHGLSVDGTLGRSDKPTSIYESCMFLLELYFLFAVPFQMTFAYHLPHNDWRENGFTIINAIVDFILYATYFYKSCPREGNSMKSNISTSENEDLRELLLAAGISQRLLPPPLPKPYNLTPV